MKRQVSFLILLLLTFTACSQAPLSNQPQNFNNVSNYNQGIDSYFSQSSEELSPRQPQEILEVADGETTTLSAELIAATIAGKDLRMMGYNGSIPGPTIKVQQGSTIFVNFVNNTDVENTLHSHGVRMKNAFDGVPGVTQDPVQPGEDFLYELTFPDPGVYWYHPHVREDYTQELGLYGNFVVEPTDPGYWNEVNQEAYIFLDDILLDRDGIVSFSQDVVDRTLMGRFGNTFLTNGQTEYALEVKKDDTVRFAFTNVASVRPFQISIENTEMKIVGGDGGRLEKDIPSTKNFLIGPSERVITEVLFNEEGKYKLLHTTPEREYVLGEITVVKGDTDNSLGSDFEALRSGREIRDGIPNFETQLEREPDKNLRLSIDMVGMGMMGGNNFMNMMSAGEQSTGMPCHQMPDGSWMGDCDTEEIEPVFDGHEMESHVDGDQKIEWEDEMQHMNTMSTDETVTWQLIDEDTRAINEDINWSFTQGDYVKVRIFNDPTSMHPMQHPIHFHGQRFVVLSTNDEPNDNLVWKDTTFIQTGDTVDILVEMSNPGEWMVHCHIPEHMHSGMMFAFTVAPMIIE